MGNGGSSKKVHPEEAFDAADADKDGKLTPEEFGAMLQAHRACGPPSGRRAGIAASAPRVRRIRSSAARVSRLFPQYL